MSQEISILIVEDEVLIAQDLKEILEEVGYTAIFKARNYQQAVDAFNTNSIDLALCDINLGDSQSGIEVANYINQHFNIPFIYITSYSDAETIASVKQTKPAGFLLKPYNKSHLLASIEIALFNYSTKGNAAEKPLDTAITEEDDANLVINNHLLVKDNHRYIKVPLTDIWWFESDKNYIEVKTLQKKYLIRSSLKGLLEQLPESDFVKCYKQFIINIHHTESFSSHSVIIKGNEIPISRSMQEEVLSKLKKQII